MQAINRIQNAMINANAGIQGGLVVDSANAHRAYPSFKPCDTTPVSKCPGKRSSSSMSQARMRSPGRMSLALTERGQLTTGPVGTSWRLDRHQHVIPTTTRVTVVVNRHTGG